MITLEQIRLLESKITRAIELIRVLKEENSTLRKGLESAQKRMKELENLVEGFKADQREIESVILRTLQHLDDLEEASAARRQDQNGKRQADVPAGSERQVPERHSPEREAPERSTPERPASDRPSGDRPSSEPPRKEELDIF
jgi:peptidoglycan hydrolase CwlO-like protein